MRNADTSVIVPPVLYLPSDGVNGSAVVRTLTDGRRGLLAYTALDRLAAACGSNQPWMLVFTDQLGAVKERQPFDVVAFDLEVPAHQLRDERLR